MQGCWRFARVTDLASEFVAGTLVSGLISHGIDWLFSVALRPDYLPAHSVSGGITTRSPRGQQNLRHRRGLVKPAATKAAHLMKGLIVANDPDPPVPDQELTGPFKIGGYEIAFTNSALFAGIAVATVTAITARRRGGVRWCQAACGRSARTLVRIHPQHGEKNVLGPEETILPLVFAVLPSCSWPNMLGMFPWPFFHRWRWSWSWASPSTNRAGSSCSCRYGVSAVILPFISLIRDHLLPVAPGEPGASLFGNAGGPHRAEGLRGLRG